MEVGGRAGALSRDVVAADLVGLVRYTFSFDHKRHKCTKYLDVKGLADVTKEL